jgi:hypothetical protein
MNPWAEIFLTKYELTFSHKPRLRELWGANFIRAQEIAVLLNE